MLQQISANLLSNESWGIQQGWTTGLIPPLMSDQWGGIKGIPTDGGDPGGQEPDSRPDSRADKARLGLADPFAPPATLNFAVSLSPSPSTSAFN